ncbi:hypothetical protein GN958_ATG23159 [Phytophthora infestans]|uniref:Uncharacterized protein n=1 Tax=Phytophthora infestans TaxID=4787 RepID=A0A8S9TIK4_PHYIN|nr:hypothetical protein GN958_ATG23159 [Phytophthora infestans]
MSRRQGFGGALRAKQGPQETEQSRANGGIQGFVAQRSLDEERKLVREQLKQIPLLSPWTSYKAYEPSFTNESNRELAQHVEDKVLDKLVAVQDRLEKLQTQRESSGVLPTTTLDTLLQSRLVVEAKRKVVPAQIAENTIAAMRAATLSVSSQNENRVSSATGLSNRQSTSAFASNTTNNMPRKPRVKTSSIISPRPRTVSNDIDVYRMRRRKSSAINYSLDTDSTDETQSDNYRESSETLLCVQFPASSEIAAPSGNKTEEDEEQHALRFRSRPVALSAIDDTAVVTTKREPQQPRVRYIMSTRLGALPPTKHILDEYPIPKEVLDALERHRHFHVDDSSPLTAFEPVRLPPPTPTVLHTSTCTNAECECFYRHSVLVERSPVSFVLSSLDVAPERPLPPPSDLFHQQQLIAATTDDSILLHEVRHLYDSTHNAHRDFRAGLHRHLDLQYLVDLSFRSSLTSSSYFVDDDDNEEHGANTQPNVQIPAHLRRHRIVSTAESDAGTSTKWKFLQNGVHRMANRRGAISIATKSEATVRAQRSDLLVQLCTLTPQDVEFLSLWYGFSPDAEAEAIAAATKDCEGGVSLDPVPMNPHWSIRFELAWKQLSLSTNDRLDLAIKYSSLAYSTRLPDAVTLWETACALVTEHEDLLRLIRSTVGGPRRHAGVSLTEDTAMLQALIASADNVREILLLTYTEVGDFVTYHSDFYLTKMEHDATEIRRLMEEGNDANANKLQSPI